MSTDKLSSTSNNPPVDPSRSSRTERPQRPPSDEFQKAMRKESKSGEDPKKKTEGEKETEGAKGKQEKAPSLFDLAAKRKKGREGKSGMQESSVEGKAAPFQAVDSSGGRGSGGGGQGMESGISGADPLTQQQRVEEVHALVRTVAKEITTAKIDGQQDTIIEIQHPPMFAGSQLVVSSFEGAKGELNLAFHNLTQEAQNLLQANEALLRNELSGQSIKAHIVIFTTQEYQPPVRTDTSQMADPREREREREQEEEGREGREE